MNKQDKAKDADRKRRAEIMARAWENADREKYEMQDILNRRGKHGK